MGIVIDMPVARILVVDDEEVILALTCRMLILHGYEVLRASGSRQALEAVNNNHPIDLIVSDNQMPGVQGTDLINQIKQFSPQTACVLMTAGEIKPEHIPDGVPVLSKPFSIKCLISTVEAALARATSRNKGQFVPMASLTRVNAVRRFFAEMPPTSDSSPWPVRMGQ
jgi:CheY-like chemotaxis protein